jgi:hypothetical protein
VALDLGIGVEVCWPYRPQEKGCVENLVGWVKGSFFKQRRFLDRAISSSSSRVAHRDQRRPPVAGDGRAAGAADQRGVPPATAGEDRAGGSGAPHPGEREPDGRGPMTFLSRHS